MLAVNKHQGSEFFNRFLFMRPLWNVLFSMVGKQENQETGYTDLLMCSKSKLHCVVLAFHL